MADPRADHQPITEGSYANVPVIGFANIDNQTRYLDIAVPCNNKGQHSIGLMWWLLCRQEAPHCIYYLDDQSWVIFKAKLIQGDQCGRRIDNVDIEFRVGNL